MLPEVERKYVGYCGWRGTVPETDISEETKAVLNGMPTFNRLENCTCVS